MVMIQWIWNVLQKLLISLEKQFSFHDQFREGGGMGIWSWYVWDTTGVLSSSSMMFFFFFWGRVLVILHGLLYWDKKKLLSFKRLWLNFCYRLKYYSGAIYVEGDWGGNFYFTEWGGGGDLPEVLAGKAYHTIWINLLLTEKSNKYQNLLMSAYLFLEPLNLLIKIRPISYKNWFLDFKHTNL